MPEIVVDLDGPILDVAARHFAVYCELAKNFILPHFLSKRTGNGNGRRLARAAFSRARDRQLHTPILLAVGCTKSSWTIV